MKKALDKNAGFGVYYGALEDRVFGDNENLADPKQQPPLSKENQRKAAPGDFVIERGFMSCTRANTF